MLGFKSSKPRWRTGVIGCMEPLKADLLVNLLNKRFPKKCKSCNFCLFFCIALLFHQFLVDHFFLREDLFPWYLRCCNAFFDKEIILMLDQESCSTLWKFVLACLHPPSTTESAAYLLARIISPCSLLFCI